MKNTIKIKKGSYMMTDEWMMKEYGSWEDNDRRQDHVCAILQRENETKSSFMFLTRTEAEALLVSANYHSIAGWDGWDDPLDKNRFEKCVIGYSNRIIKALKH